MNDKAIWKVFLVMMILLAFLYYAPNLATNMKNLGYGFTQGNVDFIGTMVMLLLIAFILYFIIWW
jgi:hypothetical protein